MRGWVYVITNKGQPGLVKVGYSMKDPDLRAAELNHTGSPFRFMVDYEMLIDEPRDVEQKTHELLSSFSTKSEEPTARGTGKEWFRRSPEEAIAAIKQIAGNRAINENYKGAERAKAEELHRKAEALRQQELQDREAKRRQQEAEQEIERRLVKEKSDINQRYQQQFEDRFPPRPFWHYWLGCSILAFIGIFMMMPAKASVSATFILAIIAGAVLAVFLQSYAEKEEKQSSEYLALEKQREAELEAVEKPQQGNAIQTHSPPPPAAQTPYRSNASDTPSWEKNVPVTEIYGGPGLGSVILFISLGVVGLGAIFSGNENKSVPSPPHPVQRQQAKHEAPQSSTKQGNAIAKDRLKQFASTSISPKRSNAIPPPSPPSVDTFNNTEFSSRQFHNEVFACAKNGDVDSLRYRLSDGSINVNIKDGEGFTPLIYASQRGYYNIVKLLVEKGANVNWMNNYDGTAIMYASGNGHYEVVKYLIDNNAKVNAVARDGDTALSISKRNGHNRIVNLLMAR